AAARSRGDRQKKDAGAEAAGREKAPEKTRDKPAGPNAAQPPANTAQDGKSADAPKNPAPEQKKAEAPRQRTPQTPSAEASAAYREGRFIRARDIWQKMADAGDARAMHNLGVLYDQGLGVEPDAGRALHWFAESAKAGDPSGMTNYARMLDLGRGIEANPGEAARWYDKAARLGQPVAQYNLGLMYEQGRGVPADKKAAAAWYARAATQFQTESLARLGHMYRVGDGVEKDPVRATHLLFGAAVNGCAPAMEELAGMAKKDVTPQMISLFGQRLDATDRTAMRAAIAASGITQARRDDASLDDVYDVRQNISGAEEMTVRYAPGKPGRLASLKLDYTAKNREMAERLLKMVESRFGEPSADSGEDARLWNLGSIIVATQFVPSHGQMSLMYLVPAVYHLTRTGR
ncbi:MAG: SEL1-like repeat protein, partial [Desulfovibrio sp.]|nr:SEL1-like repeat protein [Desulfovibrio sp.]